MATRYSKMNPDIVGTIVKHIKAGAYDYIAAQAAGIHVDTFRNWLKWGESDAVEHADYNEFRRLVMQARAEARRIAEGRVWDEKPDTWLLKGPGRERPGEPGWSNETTVNVNASDAPIKLTWVDDETTDDPATEAA
jgi:hypothetical protein